MSDSPWIIEATAQNFTEQVLERSTHIPVVVDFWAPWCGPCRQLAPVLEKLAEESAGAFLLAKVDTDSEPALASSFGVQGIPFVVAIRDQQMVDQFVGVLPEATLREWITALLPTPAEKLVRQGESLAFHDPMAAELAFREALQLAPDLVAAKLGLARLLISGGEFAEPRSLIEQLEARGFLEPEAERLKSQLEVAQTAERTGGVAAARRRSDEQPGNPLLRLELAEALAAEGQLEEALDLCVLTVSTGTPELKSRAKDALLDILNLPGVDGDLASDYRRKLASALY